MTSETDSLIFVVDDDESVRESLASLLRSAGYRVLLFGLASDFLDQSLPAVPCCLILDVRLPEITGMELQQELKRRKIDIPIVFITGHGDIPMSVRAIKAGAVEFLPKPFHDEDLLTAIEQALERDRNQRGRRTELDELSRRFASLSPRERQVMELVVTGMLNKQIAFSLKVSEATIKVHRGQVMQKMQADSLADLVKMSEKLKASGRT